MEALDQLLMACHCQSINLFVESFLKMVRKLLEADKPNLQILGTNSVNSVYAVITSAGSKINGTVHPRMSDMSAESQLRVRYEVLKKLAMKGVEYF